MAKKVTYKLEQLPSSIENDCMWWSTGDFNIRIEKTDNNKMRLRGEALDWDEATEEWTGTPLTRDECLDVCEESKLVFPGNGKYLTDIFKRKVKA